jgi:DNA-binding response OmpR family regulator
MDTGISQFVQWMKDQTSPSPTLSPKILLLSDQAEWFPEIQSSLRQLGCQTAHATSLEAAAFRISMEETKIVLVDASLPAETIKSWIQRLRAKSSSRIPYLLVPQESHHATEPFLMGCDAMTPAFKDQSLFLDQLQKAIAKQ